MTKDEILAMKPGRELDTLVAEKIFGLEYMECIGCYIDSNGDEQKIQRHSTDIETAWEVIEKIIANKLEPMLSFQNGLWCMAILNARYNDPFIDLAQCKTAPEAICKAALVAVSKVGDVDGL